jgi:hypothetical protein
MNFERTCRRRRNDLELDTLFDLFLSQSTTDGRAHNVLDIPLSQAGAHARFFRSES